ncbi:MAG: Ig-like domain-containing protein, partial [Pseudomonadota bacterium]
INADGSFTFDPAPNFNGNVPEVTYTVVDDNGGSDMATLNINIGALNDAPVAVDDGPFTVTEDMATSGTVLPGTMGQDSDADGDTITVSEFTVTGLAGTFMAGDTATIPTVGTLVINANGTFTFTPAANYNGPVPTATYTITDGNGGSDSAMLSFNDVTPVNDAPVAVNDTASADEDMQASGDLTPGTMGQDNDVDGDTLFVSEFVVNGMTVTVDRMTGGSVTLTEGTLTINADGSFTFDPAPNFNGNVPEVTYTVVDDNGGSDTATLNINIGALNDAPVAVDDGPFTVTEDMATSGTVLPGTMGQDSDADGDTITVSEFTVTGLAGTFMAGDTATIPTVGTLVIN